MKKHLIILVVLFCIGISVNAQSTSSCKVESVSGAYIVAEAQIIQRGGILVNATAYGIENGSVECTIKYIDSREKTQETSGLIYFRKDQNGNVTGILRKDNLDANRITDTKVYGAVCRK